jgi:hypothetical protein
MSQSLHDTHESSVISLSEPTERADYNQSQNLSSMMFGPTVDDLDIDGLDLDAAAEELGIGVDDVWRRIRNGQLLARTQSGRVYVYTHPPVDEQHSDSVKGLPPLPHTEQATEVVLTRMEEALTPRDSEAHISSLAVSVADLTTIINHLSLSKEENREIIRLTSDSMNRLTQMTDAVIKMKDDVINAREEQVESLRSELDLRDHELRRLTREKENLETVARFLTGDDF